VVENRQDLAALVRHQRQVDGIDADVTEPLQFVETGMVRSDFRPQDARAAGFPKRVPLSDFCNFCRKCIARRLGSRVR
jgi:hypothetical protein